MGRKGIVKGWLLVFLILSIISFFFCITGLIKIFRGLEFQNSLVFALVWFVGTITNFFYIIFLLRKSKKIKYGVFIGKPLEILAWVFLIITVFNSPPLINISSFIIQINGVFTGFVQIFLSVIWILYFVFSKRVKETLN
jgi:hypothetical protein